MSTQIHKKVFYFNNNPKLNSNILSYHYETIPFKLS